MTSRRSPGWCLGQRSLPHIVVADSFPVVDQPRCSTRAFLCSPGRFRLTGHYSTHRIVLVVLCNRWLRQHVIVEVLHACFLCSG